MRDPKCLSTRYNPRSFMVVYRRIAPDLEIPKINITTNNDAPNNETEKKVTLANNSAPHAILMCRPNSHPFQERHLVLDQPVKIGRSVARCRPGSSNAIFDCKVLSRNHALVWYENGKFFLQDTKSSNGTFINNQRLSKGSEESQAREVCSGDIVQFGVDVVENTRKVTHGCIIATLKLFLPDGKEAKASPTTGVTNAYGSTISSQDLYQLSQCLQEALHREQQLEAKLAKLQKMVNNTYEASNTNWKALIDEDRLISRIENLESQLITVSKNVSDEKLREEVVKLLEDKDRYQNTAKESLIKVFQEKLEVLRKLQDIENTTGTTKEEGQHLRESYEKAQKEIQLLAEKADEYLKEITILTQKLREAEEKEEKANKVMEEKILLEEQVVNLKENMAALLAKVEALQADKDFASRQLSCLKAHYDQTQKEKLSEDDDYQSFMDKSLEDEKGKMEELTTLISEDSSDSLLTKLFNENGKDEGHESKKNNSKGELNDLDKHNIFIELKAEIERHKELLDETRKKKGLLESEVTRLKDELEEVLNSSKNSEKKSEMLESEIAEQKKLLEEKNNEIITLQEKLQLLEERSKISVQPVPESSEYLSKACDTLKAKVESLDTSKDKTKKEELISVSNAKSELTGKGDDYLKLEAKLESIEKELEETREELFTVKESYAECNEKKAILQKELKAVSEEMQLIAYQTKTVSACSVIPLILLCLAILLAICPYLSYFTATSDATESNT